ncbi:MAG: nuclear transport factor 2 family protein [Pseudomonadales bacterium]
MPMSVQEISDRMEINNLLIDYCGAVDARDIDAFDRLFTTDAYIDYTALGGIKGNLQEIKAYLKKALALFSNSQHLIANSRVWIDGDEATARTICHNPMQLTQDDSSEYVMFFGLWYIDKLVRTEDGWRFKERIEERCYDFNVPQEFKAAATD